MPDGQSHPGPHLRGDSQPLSPSLTQACFTLVKESPLSHVVFIQSPHTHTHPPRPHISHTPHRRNTPLHTIPLNRHPTKHMHAHHSHRHVQSLSSQTPQHTPHHSRDSTACTPLLTHAPLISTPLHAISHIYTAVLNTHIHTYTLLQNLRAYTQSHYVNAQPSIFTTHICT